MDDLEYLKFVVEDTCATMFKAAVIYALAVGGFWIFAA